MGSCEVTLLLEMGPLRSTGEACKGGLQGRTSPYPLSWRVCRPQGGHSLKIRDGYVRPHWPPFSNLLSLNDPHFIFHILLSLNDPHFQNALSLINPILKIKMLSLNDPFLNKMLSVNEPPFSSINDHLLICTRYFFGRRDLYSCYFALRLRASLNDPPFFF